MIDEARLFGSMSLMTKAIEQLSDAVKNAVELTTEVRQIRADNENYRSCIAGAHEQIKLRIRQRRCLRRIEYSLVKLIADPDVDRQMTRKLRSILTDTTTTLANKTEKED